MDTDNFYLNFKKERTDTRIFEMNIPNELKEKLYDANNKLYNYSIKINKSKIKSKVSFIFLLDNLRSGEKRFVINTIMNMFKEYELCLGKMKTVDTEKDNIGEALYNIGDADFWEFVFSETESPRHLKYLSSDLKLYCKDVIKCIFIVTKGELFKNFNEIYNNDNNPYKECRYGFDEVFKVTSKKGIYKDLKKYLTDDGFDCDFNSDDIISVDEYRDNETYIETALIKKSILKDDNKLSFKDLNIITKDTKNNLIPLDKMIGLNNIKEEFKNLEYLLKFYKDTNQDKNVFLSLVFKGNPGTGKTTVARNYADLLYKLGYIKTNKLIETVPNDFMGGYVGQTKWQVEEILDKAKDGVLFIDEAYNLMEAKEGSGGTYMREVVVSLLKYMENRSNVVIFAGYKNEMDDLVENINPGFKSRIGRVFDFEDYTTKELMQIFKFYAENKHLKCNKSFENKLKKHIEKAKTSKNFGNARYMENILNEILYTHAKNVYENKKDMFELTAEDINLKDKSTNNFGFGVKKECE